MSPKFTLVISPPAEGFSRPHPCGDTTAILYIACLDERATQATANSRDAAAGSFASLHPKRCALLRNENRRRRRDLVHRREIALVLRQPNSPARINVQQGIPNRHIHERFRIRRGERFFIQQDRDAVAYFVPKILELFAGNVCDQRTKWIIQRDHFAFYALGCHSGGLWCQPDKLLHFWPDQRVIPPRCQMRPNRRKNVPPVERRRDGVANHPTLVRDFTC